MDLSGISTRQIAAPPPVRPGDRVGIAALSGPVDGEALQRGIEALWELGFEPVLAGNLLSRSGFFAGDDAQRLQGFHELASDDSLGAIIFARGGHGVLRLLPSIDWQLLAKRPRAYVGYSDLTPLLNVLVMGLGQIALHGPMVAVDLARGLDDREVDSLLRGLAGERQESLPVAGAGGAVEGRLIGGCLSLMGSVVGTEFQLQADGAIVFWEDVGEPLYRLDRMLTQLRLAESMRQIEGMVIGRFELHEDDRDDDLLPELMVGWGAEFGCPISFGIESGHCQPNLTLPLGARVRLDADQGELVFLE